MGVKALSLESICEADGGRVAAAVNAAILAAVRDCEDRPRNQTARVVTLQIGLKPAGKDAAENEVDFAFAVSSKLPKGESGIIRGVIRKAPGQKLVLAFNDLSTDNPDQATLDDESPEAWQ